MGVLMSLLVTTLFFVVSLPLEVWFGCIGGLIGGLVSGSDASGFQVKGRRSLRFQTWRSLSLLGVYNGVLVGGLVAAGFALWGNPASLYDWLIYGSSIGLCSFLLTIIIASGKRSAQYSVSSGAGRHWWHRMLWQGLQADHLRLGLVVGLLVGLSDGLGYGLSHGLISGLSDGLVFGAIGVFLSVLLLGRKSIIELTELLVWSGKSIGRSLVSKRHLSVSGRIALLLFLSFGLSEGLSLGLLNELVEGLSAGLIVGLSVGLSVGIAYWLLFGLWNGLSRETLDDHLRTRPNQGIARSVRSALFVGVLAGMICFLVGSLNEFISLFLYGRLSDGLSDTLRYVLSKGLLLGCMGALLAALLTGGLASLRHLLLRLQLRRLGVVPQHFVRFLDDMARRILLRKVGGGYIFIHRLLLDYLASLETLPVIGDTPEQQLPSSMAQERT